MIRQKIKQKILIADDSEINRAMLSDILGDEYKYIEAANGAEALAAIEKYETELALVLLDIVMPEVDGFGVLTEMNRQRWIEDIPVIMISAETRSAHIDRAYELGVTDFIARPFDAAIVHRRVVNTILLYTKQKNLANLVAEQIYEKEHQSALMVNILSHIVEFRNGESGSHVLNIHTLTELLLKHLVLKTDRYTLSKEDISLISTAAALHDIGKIAIPEEILNKPGRLTDEEFAVMKTHAEEGAKMLDSLRGQDEPLIDFAYEICRWHHERYDGRGYPDGLSGEEIPISAQVVAVADVYDALTSERVYKAAYPHEVAVQMILDGKCGTFSPLLMECLQDIADVIQRGLRKKKNERLQFQGSLNISEENIRPENRYASERTLQLLEHERMKYNFFAAMSQEIQFEYSMAASIVTISAWGAKKLGLDETVFDPQHKKQVLSLMDEGQIHALSDMLRSTTPEHPVVNYEFQMGLHGEKRWTQIISRATWSADDPPRYMGAIGKAVDVHDARMKWSNLEWQASHDVLTGLFNFAYAKERVQERMTDRVAGKFVLMIIDLDHFKEANDQYGHTFGNQVLIYIAEKLRQITRSGDIAARVGGDEFLVSLEYKDQIEPGIERIFHALTGQMEDYSISVSMGIAKSEMLGRDYETLFRAADQALYAAKRSGRGRYRFYDDSMRDTLSSISPIHSMESGRNGGGER